MNSISWVTIVHLSHFMDAYASASLKKINVKVCTSVSISMNHFGGYREGSHGTNRAFKPTRPSSQGYI